MSTDLQPTPFEDDKHVLEHEEAVPKEIVDNQQEINDLIHKPTKWANFGFYWQCELSLLGQVQVLMSSLDPVLCCRYCNDMANLQWILFGFDVGIVGSL
jgi:hypothetical protein